jgi:hypothetical protein
LSFFEFFGFPDESFESLESFESFEYRSIRPLHIHACIFFKTYDIDDKSVDEIRSHNMIIMRHRSVV